MKSFKLEKNVNPKEYFITGIISLIIFLIFRGSALGGLFFMLSIGSFGMSFFITGKKMSKTLNLLTIIGIFLIGLFIFFISMFFVGFFQGLNPGFSTNQTNKTVNNSNTYFLDETWQVFNSTEGNFKVNFPKYPTISEKETHKISDNSTLIITHYSSVGEDGDSYGVSHGYYPEILSKNYNVKNGLEGMINTLVNSHESNKLISSFFLNIGKYQGVDYVIYNKQENTYVRGRNIIVAEKNNPLKIYILMVSSTSKNPSNNFTKFINSFEIL